MRAATKKTTACLLFPTDFQQPARRAFNYGIKLARLLGLRMEILHVIKALPDRSGPPPDSRYLRALKTSALLDLGRLARITKEAGVTGGAVPAIRSSRCLYLSTCEIYARRDHRHGDRRTRGMGSLAPRQHGAHRRLSGSLPGTCHPWGLAGDAARHPARVKLERLLAATDFSPDADQALQAVSTLARLTQAKVCVVHVAGQEASLRLRAILDARRPIAEAASSNEQGGAVAS